MAVNAPVEPRLYRARAADESSGLWSLGLAHEVTTRLAEPAAFDAAITRLAGLLSDLDCTRAAGVSPKGQLLANAVARASNVSVWNGAEPADGRLALIEVVVNSGVNLVAAMRDARAAGASDVVGVSLVAQTIAITAWADRGETLRAVEEV